MKTFILLSAIPGSGKSTWAKKYKSEHKNVFIVSSDELRKELGGAVQNFEHEEEMWNRFKEDIIKHKDAYDDVTVIADATNITNNLRIMYAKLAKDFDKKILVVFKKSKEDINKFNKEREPGRIVPQYAIDKMVLKWEEINDEVRSLYDKIIEVNGYFN